MHPSPGGTSYRGAPPKRDTIFRLQVYDMRSRCFTGWSICHYRLWKDLKGLTVAFYGYEKCQTTFWFSHWFKFKKEHHFPIKVYKYERGSFFSKMVHQWKFHPAYLKGWTHRFFSPRVLCCERFARARDPLKREPLSNKRSLPSPPLPPYFLNSKDTKVMRRSAYRWRGWSGGCWDNRYSYICVSSV